MIFLATGKYSGQIFHNLDYSVLKVGCLLSSFIFVISKIERRLFMISGAIFKAISDIEKRKMRLKVGSHVILINIKYIFLKRILFKIKTSDEKLTHNF